MKDISTMTPAELRQTEIELKATIDKTLAAKQLTIVKKEIFDRKKKFWRPEVMRLVQNTGRASGVFASQFGSRIEWEYKTRKQTAQIIDVVNTNIII